MGNLGSGCELLCSKIEVVLSKLNDDDAACIRAAKNALSSPEVRNQLAFIRSNYGFIPSLIESVEARNVQLADSLRHIDEMQGMLADVQGTVGERLQKKLDAVLSKNAGLQVLRQISAVLGGYAAQKIDDDYHFTPQEISDYRYAPVVSCDVERSFSKYRAVLRDNRQSFLFDNLHKHLIIYCNP
jgi:hypothetical protein